ncbi:MAG: hypothetical protein LBU43_06345 [Candidatus Accumulibacter sp.]|nr:hypothetical protein [Accumulibacter sp.]
MSRFKSPPRAGFSLSALFSALSLLPMAAYTQTPPLPDAGRILQETRPVLPPAERKAPAPLIEQRDDRPLSLPAGETLTVKEFRFEGAEFIAETELQDALASYRGRTLTLAEIEEAARRITNLYRERGYLVARVWVPRQDASGGTLTLRVVPGKYGQVSVRNHSFVDDARIAAYFAGLSGDQAVTREELERAMLLVGELPGVNLPKVSISPGKDAGTSDFAIDVDADKRYSGYASLDNLGSRYTGKGGKHRTGKGRLSVGASWYSPVHLGDALDFSGMSNEGGGLTNARLAWSTPLGASGLRGELAAQSAHYRVGDVFEELRSKGRADALEANFTYPILLTRSQNLRASLGLVGRDLRDELRAVDRKTSKRSYAATFGLNYDRYGSLLGHDAYFSLGGSLTFGKLNIDEADERALNKADGSAKTVGRYGRANLSALARLAVTERLSASASLTAQRAMRRNLDSSEQFQISGIYGVAAYREVVSGDHGYWLNVEMRYALPAVTSAPGLRHAVSVFADTAHVNLHNPGYSTVNGVTSKSVGVGYNVTWGTLFARLRVANASGRWPESVPSDDRHTRFLAQVGVVF